MYEIEGSKNFMCPDWDAQEAYQVKDFELKSVVKLKDFVLQDCKDNLEGWIEYMKENGVSHDFNPYLYNDLVVEGCTITHKDENGMIDGQIDVDVSYDLPEKSVSDLTVEDFKIQVEFNYRPLNKDFLRSLVRDCRVDLGDIDTSKITDMSNLFLSTNFAENLRENSTYKGIEKWNTSSVTNMNYMFANCEYFNQDIGNWDVSKVENMKCMFVGCKEFNQDLNDWAVREDCKVKNIFYNSALSLEHVKKAFTQDQLQACGSEKIIDVLNNEKEQKQETKKVKGAHL